MCVVECIGWNVLNVKENGIISKVLAETWKPDRNISSTQRHGHGVEAVIRRIYIMKKNMMAAGGNKLKMKIKGKNSNSG